MARKKMSKKEFNDQFEAFLKESVSSEESMDSARIAKFLEPPRKKERQPWWMAEDDDNDEEFGTGLSASGKSFLKKKPEPENSTPIRDDKTTSIRNTKPEMDVESSSADSGKRSVSKTDRTKGKREVKPRVVRGKTDASMSKDSLEDISEKSEEESGQDRKIATSSVETSRNGIGRVTGPGMDTLDEQAEKERFFQEMENNAEGTIDYGRLNQELSQTGTTMSPEGAAKTAATLAALEDIEENGALRQPPGSHVTSEITNDNSAAKPSMLSKVSLMDSMESTMNTTTSPKVGRSQNTLQDAQKLSLDDMDGPAQFHQSTPGSFKTGTGGTGSFCAGTLGFMGTNTSQEIEALQKALREVGLSPTIKNDSQPFDSSTHGNKSTSELLQKILASEPEGGKERTVEEVLQEMENIQKQGKYKHSDDPDVELLSDKKKTPSPRGLERQRHIPEEEELRGFGLSPIVQDISSQGGFDNSHTEDTEMYQPVTQIQIQDRIERGRSKKKEGREMVKKTNSKESLRQKSMKLSSPRQSASPRGSPRRWMSPRTPGKEEMRSRSSSPSKPGATLKNKYSHIKSSGYGVQSPGKPPSAREKSPGKPLSARERSPSKPSSARDRNGNKQQQKMSSTMPVGDKMEKTAGKSKKEKKDRPTHRQWSPAEVSRQKVIGSDSPVQHKKTGAGMDSQLRASVESFTSYIRDHFTGQEIPQVKHSEEEPSLAASWKGEKSGGLDETLSEVDKLQGQLKDNKMTRYQLSDEIEAIKREYERKLEKQRMDYEDQIVKLKQENYVLQAKLPSAKEEVKKQVINGQTEGISKDQMERLQKDLQEQETLLAGYQQENKRLYDQMKNLQKQAKQTEERMFNENQKMATEIANLNEQLNRKDHALSNKGVITGLEAQQKIAAGDSEDVVLGAGQIAQLSAELREAKRNESNLQRELQVYQRTKGELEQHIDKLIKEREDLQQKLKDSKSAKLEEAKENEEKQKAEIDRLSRKLKWYAENQKLLDKDVKLLRERDDEIFRLKIKIEELQTETGKKLEENRLRTRERAADAKKIQDLQRQVKEMEQIMKKRYPNSLPALMMTAAFAPNDKTNNKTPYTEVLENRVKKLEEEIESKDQEEEKMLRSVEQKYNNIKMKYEERIKDLEMQIAAYRRPDDMDLKDYEHPHTHSVALQRELETTRDRYKKQVTDLQGQVTQLTTELSKVKKNQESSLKNELKVTKEMESDLSNKVRVLQMELESKNHDLQVLHKSIERLRKEKQLNIINGVSVGKKKGKQITVEDEEETESLKHVSESQQNEKQVIEGLVDARMSKLMSENEHLKAKVEQLMLEVEHNRLEVRKSQAEHESFVRQSREHYEEEIEALCSSHKKELQTLLAEQALEHSTSKLAQLQSRTNAQEVMITHLKEQVANAQVEVEQMSILKIRKASLETQVEKLQEQLRDAKKFHSPEMKHFEAIQEKILSMERKHEQRESELQQLVQKTKDAASSEISDQANKWKQIVETKNHEIQRFRAELDSILDVLRLLQKQGVVLPVRTSVS